MRFHPCVLGAIDRRPQEVDASLISRVGDLAGVKESNRQRRGGEGSFLSPVRGGQEGRESEDRA